MDKGGRGRRMIIRVVIVKVVIIRWEQIDREKL